VGVGPINRVTIYIKKSGRKSNIRIFALEE